MIQHVSYIYIGKKTSPVLKKTVQYMALKKTFCKITNIDEAPIHTYISSP